MGSTRFIGVFIFYAIGIILSVIGAALACHYQDISSRNIRQAKAYLGAVGNGIPEVMKKIAASKGRLQPSEWKELEIRDMTLRRRWMETRSDFLRVEREYRTGMRRRNYAMMLSVLGFAAMVWGLFRLLKD